MVATGVTSETGATVIVRPVFTKRVRVPMKRSDETAAGTPLREVRIPVCRTRV